MQCLNDHQVFDLVGGLLKGEVREAAEEHLRGCEACTARVRDSRERLLARTFSPRQVAVTQPVDGELFGDEITEPQGLKGGMPEAGRVLSGRYKLLKVIGHGGMGVVYEAEDQLLQGTVAVKLLVRELASEPSFVEQLHQEIRLGRRISNSRVCRVHDLGTDGNLHFLVMERVLGQTLEALIEQSGAPTHEQTYSVLEQLCDALQAAEEAGVVHRDLKPANVMIDAQGRIKVMDFGLARDARVDRSQYGLAKGTPAYWAPEQARGEAATASSDIFALGMTALDLFSGKFPWQRTSDEALAKVPAPYLPIVRRCLETDPQKRPRSAAEVRQALAAARLELIRRRRPAARWPFVAAAALAGALVGALALYPVLAKVAPPKEPPAAAVPVTVAAEEPPRVAAVEPPVSETLDPLGPDGERQARPDGQQPPSGDVAGREVEEAKPEEAAGRQVEEAPPARKPESGPQKQSVGRREEGAPQKAAVERKETSVAPAPRPPAAQIAAATGRLDAVEQALAAKALVPEDLPGFPRRLSRARTLVAEERLDEAREAISELERELAAVKVDAKLVSAKLQRLNGELRARALPQERSAPLYALFEKVQASYFRGDYAAANQTLNELEARLHAR